MQVCHCQVQRMWTNLNQIDPDKSACRGLCACIAENLTKKIPTSALKFAHFAKADRACNPSHAEYIIKCGAWSNYTQERRLKIHIFKCGTPLINDSADMILLSGFQFRSNTTLNSNWNFYETAQFVPVPGMQFPAGFRRNISPLPGV